jgi:hypothetical protein
MANESARPEGASALARLVGRAYKRAFLIFSYFLIGMLAVLVLTELMGGSNGATFLAIAIVVGAEIGLRRHEKKKASQFGDTARGTEVADHTKEGGQ